MLPPGTQTHISSSIWELRDAAGLQDGGGQGWHKAQRQCRGREHATEHGGHHPSGHFSPFVKRLFVLFYFISLYSILLKFYLFSFAAVKRKSRRHTAERAQPALASSQRPSPASLFPSPSLPPTPAPRGLARSRAPHLPPLPPPPPPPAPPPARRVGEGREPALCCGVNAGCRRAGRLPTTFEEKRTRGPLGAVRGARASLAGGVSTRLRAGGASILCPVLERP